MSTDKPFLELIHEGWRVQSWDEKMVTVWTSFWALGGAAVTGFGLALKHRGYEAPGLALQGSGALVCGAFVTAMRYNAEEAISRARSTIR